MGRRERKHPAPGPRAPVSELESISTNLIHLRRQAGSAAFGRDREIVEEAVEELSVTVEEMRAAEAELALQNERLAEGNQEAEARVRRYREFFESAPDGFVVTDGSGSIEEANGAIGEMLSVSARFLVGKPLAAFVLEEDRPAFRARLNRLEHDSETGEWLLRLQPRGRPAFQATARMTLVKGPHEFAWVQWSLRPVTEGQSIRGKREDRSPAAAAFGQYRDLQSVSDVWLEPASRGLESLLRNFLLRVRHILSGDTATILLMSGKGPFLEVRAAVGGQEMAANQIRVPLGRGFAGRIAAEREPTVVPDLAKVEIENPFLRANVRSLVGVPLIVDDRVIGVLHVGSIRLNHFTSANLHFLRLAADRAAMAIENARLYESEQRARREAERTADRAGRLQRVMAALSEALTPAQVAGVVIEQSVGALGAAAALVCQADPDGSTLQLLQASGYDDDVVASFSSVPIESRRPIAWAVRERRPLFFESHAEFSARFPEVEELASRIGGGGIAVVPLLLEGRAHGALYLQFAHPRGFVEEDRSFLMSLGHQCAQALDRARLYESERDARSRAEASQVRLAFLAEAGALLAEARTVPEVVDDLARLAVTFLADFCLVDVVDPDGDLSRMASVTSDPAKQDLAQALRERFAPGPRSRLPSARVIRTGRPEFASRVSDDFLREIATDRDHLAALRSIGVDSWVAVPLSVRDRVLGAMTLLATGSGRRLEATDMGLAEELARRAALAIDNAMLYEAEQRARALAEEAAGRAAVLQSVTASLSEAPTPAEVAEVVVERGLAALGASAASIALRRDSDIEVLRSIGYRDEQVEPWRTFPVDAAVPLADAIRTGNPVFLRSREERDAMYPNLSTSWPTGDRAWAAIPLTVQGSTLGAMGLSFRDVREFDEGDRGLMFALARQAAQAIQRARLYESQRHIATVLQRSLLPPSLPAIPGIEVAVRYRAAGEGIEVGGDFFDVFEAGDDEWAVVIGDVCGKGPEAAAVTGLARNTLRAAALHEHRPSRLLRILNEAILSQTRDDRFCTICYARLRPNPFGIRVTLSAGGHPLPLVLREDGTTDTVGFPGTLLGVFSEPDLADHVVDLGHGDVMILFTDGLIEARGGSESLGERGLAEVLAASAGLDVEKVAGRIEEAVLGQAPLGLRDDLAYIVLRVVSE